MTLPTRSVNAALNALRKAVQNRAEEFELFKDKTLLDSLDNKKKSKIHFFNFH